MTTRLVVHGKHAYVLYLSAFRVTELASSGQITHIYPKAETRSLARNHTHTLVLGDFFKQNV